MLKKFLLISIALGTRKQCSTNIAKLSAMAKQDPKYLAKVVEAKRLLAKGLFSACAAIK